jgi:Asp-tRNA(Asn)/Glu-tRNA(Gln) amidotransferase A subunit family amidase
VWGATGNPFNPNLNAGGSSGGSAAALACDMLPVCTGSDTGGSLRIPAAKCGVVGFRPSPGIVPSVRKLLGWTPISVVGPMGRTVEDACLQMAASAGMHAGDPLSYPLDPLSFLKPAGINLSNLRVAWTEDFGTCAVDDGIRATMRKKIGAMRHLFKRCDKIELDLGEAHRCFDVLRAEAFVAGMHAAYQRDPASLGPNSRANYEMGAQMSLLDSAWAQAEQTRLIKRFQAAFADYDLILSPTTPVSPFPWTQLYADTINGEKQANYYRWLALTYVVTLTTHPALSLPCGLDHAGMPFGLQIVGAFRADHQVLGAAHAMEQAFAADAQLRRPRPDIASLRAAEPALTSIVTAPPGAHGGAPADAEVSAV